MIKSKFVALLENDYSIGFYSFNNLKSILALGLNEKEIKRAK